MLHPALMFVDPSKDWLTHMQQLLPIENPRGVAVLAKQKFADSYQEFDSDPTDPECPHRQRSTYCHLMHRADDSGLLVAPAYISADMPLAQKKAIAAVHPAAAPIECNTKHTVAPTGTSSHYRKLHACRVWGSIMNQRLLDLPKISYLTPCSASGLAVALPTLCWC
jgi:hypothetical protein